MTDLFLLDAGGGIGTGAERNTPGCAETTVRSWNEMEGIAICHPRKLCLSFTKSLNSPRSESLSNCTNRKETFFNFNFGPAAE